MNVRHEPSHPGGRRPGRSRPPPPTGRTPHAALLAALLAIGLGFFLPVRPVAAAECTCEGEIPPLVADYAEISEASGTFSGRIVEMEPDIRPGVRGLTMEVDEVWLGDIEEVMEVETLMVNTDCGVEHEVGTEMLVFTVVGLADEGRGTGDETVILPCGGSRDSEEASVLGPGHAPSPVSEDDDGTPWLAGGLIGLGSLAVAGAAVVLVRRARRADAT